MVVSEGGNSPTVRHDNIIEAIREAERIARKNERNCHVLECVGVVHCQKEITTKYKEIEYDPPSNPGL